MSRQRLARRRPYMIMVALAVGLWVVLAGVVLWSASVPNVELGARAFRPFTGGVDNVIEVIGTMRRNRRCDGAIMTTSFVAADGSRAPAPRMWHTDPTRIGKAAIEMYNVPIGSHEVSGYFEVPPWAVAIEYRMIEPGSCDGGQAQEYRLAWIEIPPPLP